MIPKGYKHTELGVLPEDWEVVRLGEVCEILAGGDVPKDAFSKIKTGEYQIPILSNGIGEKALYGFTNQARIEKPCITISARGTIGYCSLQTEPFYPIVRLIVVLPKAGLNPRFLYYVTMFADIEGTKSGIPQLTIPMVKKIQIPLPPLAEQEKIAKILSTWDTQIQNFETLIAEKQTLKKGLCQTLLTAKTRLKGFSGNWKVVSVGEIFRVTRGNILATDRLSDLPSGKNCYPVFSSKTKDGGLLGYYSEYLFEDCITWTTDGANAGDVNFRKGKFYCTNVCGVLISDAGYCNQCVAEILNLRTRQYVSYVGNPKLMNNTMKEIEIEIPSNIAEQEKIAEILSEADNEITLLEQKLKSLKSQKRGLMQNLLNGKVRVKVCQ